MTNQVDRDLLSTRERVVGDIADAFNKALYELDIIGLFGYVAPDYLCEDGKRMMIVSPSEHVQHIESGHDNEALVACLLRRLKQEYLPNHTWEQIENSPVLSEVMKPKEQ